MGAGKLFGVYIATGLVHSTTRLMGLISGLLCRTHQDAVKLLPGQSKIPYKLQAAFLIKVPQKRTNPQSTCHWLGRQLGITSSYHLLGDRGHKTCLIAASSNQSKSPTPCQRLEAYKPSHSLEPYAFLVTKPYDMDTPPQ